MSVARDFRLRFPVGFGQGLALRVGGALALRDLAFLGPDVHALIVQDDAVAIGVLRRDLVGVPGNAVLVCVLEEPLRVGATDRQREGRNDKQGGADCSQVM
jgi:hypothetical protein